MCAKLLAMPPCFCERSKFTAKGESVLKALIQPASTECCCKSSLQQTSNFIKPFNDTHLCFGVAGRGLRHYISKHTTVCQSNGGA